MISRVGSSATHVDYRPDVDGLRAVAILLVVGYHAFPRTVPGGFIGVDVFFVISGFLISSIILKGLRRETFSYFDFYVRRIRRIFPALMVVLAACLVVGWFGLFEAEYQQLGKHVAGGAGFVANFIYWQEAGYFDQLAIQKPLLHLWSLGVEEQFYLIWPLLLALAWKRARLVMPMIAVLLVVSLLLNLLLIAPSPSATFYLPATRFWELMLGSVLAYRSVVSAKASLHGSDSRQFATAEVLCWSGAAMLAAALWVIDNQKPFPGALALLPTLGASLIIAAGPTASVNRLLLASRPMVFVGLISFPLYLWHWPLLSLTHIESAIPPSRGIRAMVVAASFLLAWLTYSVIEGPIRASRKPAVAGVLLVVAAIVGGLGLFVYEDGGVADRAFLARNTAVRSIVAESLAEHAHVRNVVYPTQPCLQDLLRGVAEGYCARYGTPGSDTVVVWGDSHAVAMSPVFYKIAHDHNLQVYVISVDGCPPVVGVRRVDREAGSTGCATSKTASAIASAIRQLSPRHIFVISRWGLFVDTHLMGPEGNDPTATLQSQFVSTLVLLAETAPVTVFRPVPILAGDPVMGTLRGYHVDPTRTEHMQAQASTNAFIDAAVAAVPGTSVFDPAQVLCSQVCNSVRGRTLLYTDNNHLLAQGALLLEDTLLRDQFGFLEPN